MEVVNDIRKYRTYYYKTDGDCELVREDDSDSYLEIMAVNNGIIYGELDKNVEEIFRTATISLEDYLAGKTNWKLLEY